MSRKSRKNVGVIGLGIIGSRVAAGLRAAGYQVYVWNRSAKPAPNFLGSPAEVADAAEIIQIFVSDAAALFEVIEAMGDALTPRHIIVCSATVGPEAVLEAAQIVENKGAQFLDAPFTGSKIAAEKRQLVYYIGGAEHAFLKAKPALEVTSKAIVQIGEVGHASSVKVVTNMISAVTAQVLAEALSIVQKAGLQPEVLAAAIEHNACRSGVIDLKLPMMIAGDFEPHFSLKHMFKDVQLGIHMANALDIEIPTTTVTAGVMYGALNQGWADLDYSALFKNYATPEPVEDELPALPHVAMSVEDVIAEASARNIGTLVEPEKPVRDADGNDKESGESSAGIASLGTPAKATAPLTPEDSSSAPSSEPVPAEAAPKKSEATADRTESKESAAGPTQDTAKKEAPPMGDTAKEEQTDKPETQPEKAPEAGAPADAKADPSKGETSEGNPAEPGVRPNNFVRRWFVARSGG